jgi:hypothetical protein
MNSYLRGSDKRARQAELSPVTISVKEAYTAGLKHSVRLKVKLKNKGTVILRIDVSSYVKSSGHSMRSWFVEVRTKHTSSPPSQVAG